MSPLGPAVKLVGFPLLLAGLMMLPLVLRGELGHYGPFLIPFAACAGLAATAIDSLRLRRKWSPLLKLGAALLALAGASALFVLLALMMELFRLV